MYQKTIDDLGLMLLIDICVFLVCLVMVKRKCSFSFLHPYFIYAFYHAYSVTYRLYAVYVGQPTMYEDRIEYNFNPITYDELIRAAMLFDLALVLFAVTAVKAESYIRKKFRNKTLPRLIEIDQKSFLRIALGSIFFGIIMAVIFRGGAGQVLGVFGQTGYAKLMANWPIVGLMMLIYLRGFQLPILILFAIFLTINALQGYHRVMTVIPLLFIAMVYLQRAQRKWPNPQIVGILFVLFLTFPFLKHIGRSVQQGDYSTARELLKESASKSVALSPEIAPDFLDQCACTLTAADLEGKVFYGYYYTTLFVYFVPRIIWPDKPSFTAFGGELFSEDRPMHREGRIVTYIGDAYINFRYVGVVFYPIALAFIFTVWYKRNEYGSYYSLSNYLYLIFAIGAIQVYRDGVPSLIMFTFVQNLPSVFVIGSEMLKKRKIASRSQILKTQESVVFQ